MTGDGLADDYRRAGFANRLGFGSRSALVVIDFCQAYLDPKSPLYAGVEDARASCQRVLGAARAAEIPVLHTRVEFQPGGADGDRTGCLPPTSNTSKAARCGAGDRANTACLMRRRLDVSALVWPQRRALDIAPGQRPRPSSGTHKCDNHEAGDRRGRVRGTRTVAPMLGGLSIVASMTPSARGMRGW